MKTAALFAIATELGAFISEADPEVITAMKIYGLKLGTAYQIYDDCLDIAGTEDKAGKTSRIRSSQRQTDVANSLPLADGQTGTNIIGSAKFCFEAMQKS